jgi:hypothetical protein
MRVRKLSYARFKVLKTDSVEYEIIYSTGHSTSQVPEHREKKPYLVTVRVLKISSRYKYCNIRRLPIHVVSHTGVHCMCEVFSVERSVFVCSNLQGM